MGKIKTCLTLIAGTAIGIGALKGIPVVINDLVSPDVRGITDNSIRVFDVNSKSVRGYFTTDEQKVTVESSMKTNRAYMEIPESIREKDRFTFYAEDPEGHKTKEIKYAKRIIWKQEQ